MDATVDVYNFLCFNYTLKEELKESSCMLSKSYLTASRMIGATLTSCMVLSFIQIKPNVVIEGSARDGFRELLFQKEIVLQTGNDLIAEIHQLKVFDNYILVVDRFIDQQVYLFDQRGNILCKIGKKGQGPGEYVYPLAGAFIENKIYIASAGNERMEVYDRNGKYLRSFLLPGIGPWQDMLVDRARKIYILNPIRYLPFSISVFDTLGKKIDAFSKPEDAFRNVFDTFYPTGGFARNKNEEIYQVFNHKYEIYVWDTHGNKRKQFRFTSSYYKSPDYEKAKTIHGISNEKKFRSTFTQIVGIYLLEPNILVIVLRNWKTVSDFEDVVEFWDDKGNFLMRYKLEQGEELRTTYARTLVFTNVGTLDKNGQTQNPVVTLKQISIPQ